MVAKRKVEGEKSIHNKFRLYVVRMVVPAIARGVKVDLGQLLLNAKKEAANNDNDKKVSIHMCQQRTSEYEF